MKLVNSLNFDFGMRLSLVLILFIISIIGYSQKSDQFRNPILPGSHPDPSICRVGDDYYIVNSTFNWFPGIPIHHSTDLVNWELIGYVFEDPSSFEVKDGVGQHGGLWAPTIRYHQGVFYVTVTNFGSGNSMITTAIDPSGDWSQPVRLHDSKGIDGSLLFDEDKVWYCFSKDHKIWFQEMDLPHLKLLGEPKLIMDEERFEGYTNIEGPHIYKLANGEYMLLIAAGGTGSNQHNVSVFKSAKPDGPYIPAPSNPVLTHALYESPISVIGHADIVETQNGEWYAVILGIRECNGYDITGRETFMTSFVWKDGWPLFNPDGGGHVLEYDKRPNLPLSNVQPLKTLDEFEGDALATYWNFFRPPTSLWHHVENGELKVTLQSMATTAQTHNPVIVRRITEHSFAASTSLEFKPENQEEAGLIAMMHHKGQLRCGIVVNEGKPYARVTEYYVNRKDKQTINERIVAEIPLKGKKFVISLVAEGLDYQFYVGVGTNTKNLKKIGEVLSGTLISRQVTGTYTGAYIGMYGTSNGQESNNQAKFNWFDYQPTF